MQEPGSFRERIAVEMTLDEYETIRLIDLLDYTQEECAVQMGVARTTVQSVYNEARKKAGSRAYGRKIPVYKRRQLCCMLKIRKLSRQEEMLPQMTGVRDPGHIKNRTGADMQFLSGFFVLYNIPLYVLMYLSALL